MADGEYIQCFTYVANHHDGEHKPNEFYKQLIVKGATKNTLPKEYVVFLNSIATC